MMDDPSIFHQILSGEVVRGLPIPDRKRAKNRRRVSRQVKIRGRTVLSPMGPGHAAGTPSVPSTRPKINRAKTPSEPNLDAEARANPLPPAGLPTPAPVRSTATGGGSSGGAPPPPPGRKLPTAGPSPAEVHEVVVPVPTAPSRDRSDSAPRSKFRRIAVSQWAARNPDELADLAIIDERLSASLVYLRERIKSDATVAYLCHPDIIKHCGWKREVRRCLDLFQSKASNGPPFLFRRSGLMMHGLPKLSVGAPCWLRIAIFTQGKVRLKAVVPDEGHLDPEKIKAEMQNEEAARARIYTKLIHTYCPEGAGTVFAPVLDQPPAHLNDQMADLNNGILRSFGQAMCNTGAELILYRV